MKNAVILRVFWSNRIFSSSFGRQSDVILNIVAQQIFFSHTSFTDIESAVENNVAQQPIIEYVHRVKKFIFLQNFSEHFLRQNLGRIFVPQRKALSGCWCMDQFLDEYVSTHVTCVVTHMVLLKHTTKRDALEICFCGKSFFWLQQI